MRNVFIIVISVLFALAIGFFVGEYHVIVDSEIILDNDIVLLEIDGHLYTHYAE